MHRIVPIRSRVMTLQHDRLDTVFFPYNFESKLKTAAIFLGSNKTFRDSGFLVMDGNL